MVWSVRCPLPVAARLPRSVTRTRAGGAVSWARKSWVARCGPMLWELDGPAPTLKVSNIESTLSRIDVPAAA
jgi:hypothetical protein